MRLANNVSLPEIHGVSGFVEVCVDGRFVPVCGHETAKFNVGVDGLNQLCGILGFNGLINQLSR